MKTEKKASKRERKAMSVSLYGNLFFVVVELVMAIITGSQAVLLDAVYDGIEFFMPVSYTHLVAVGYVTDEQREVYNVVLKAQRAACEAIRPGITGQQADAAARNVITAAGYGHCFGHALGHGVGLEIHEAPTANPRSIEVLEKNMLITVEPGIYLPKKFGVRIEDLSVVGDSAIINLVTSEKELIIL